MPSSIPSTPPRSAASRISTATAWSSCSSPRDVNKLSPNCNTTGSVILGFFFGLDLLPGQAAFQRRRGLLRRRARHGHAGCTVPEADAISSLPPVFIHEFQHMISFNQHVLIRGGTVRRHLAERGPLALRRGARGRQHPRQPLRAGVRQLRVAVQRRQHRQRLLATWTTPESNFLIEPSSSTGTLAERGANWLFVRWLTDHFATDLRRAPTSPGRSMQTNLVGAANVAAVTGEDFASLVSQWQLANYLDQPAGLHALEPSAAVHYLDLRAIFQANFQQRSFRQALSAHPRQHPRRHLQPDRACCAPAPAATCA